MLAPQPRAGGVSVGKGSKIRRHRTCRGLDGKAQAIFSCVQLRKFYLMNNHRAHNYVTFRLSRFISLSLSLTHTPPQLRQAWVFRPLVDSVGQSFQK